MLNQKPFHKDVGALIGLFAISCSTLMLEIVLTKFLSYKLYHHMTFAILSTVILSLGAAGILSFLRPRFLGLNSNDPWSAAGRCSMLYAISVAIVIPIICMYPIFPNSTNLGVHSLALPAIFLLLALPFLFGGICISQTLTYCSYSVQIVYFWDLLAAAIGAAVCPVVLPYFGGFGTVGCISILGICAAFFYWLSGDKANRKIQVTYSILAIGAVVLCLYYPIWAKKMFKLDIITTKDIGPLVAISDFGGLAYTHWNAIARVDVSNTGTSSSPVFRYGLSPNSNNEKIFGRYITLDGGANTRQFKIDGPIKDKSYLGSALWASPYIVKPDCKKSLVFGGGGGIDILVAKYFSIPNLTVVELNPDVYNLLIGRADDPGHLYSRSLVSDANTEVLTVCDEARHFASIQPTGKYDTIQSSGVDTLTAIQTGGMSLVENYLYTVEAVRDYVRILKPGGILSLTHWRTDEPATSLRMFATYLEYLDSVGVKEPWRHIVVVGTRNRAPWSDSMLNMTPFTPEELAHIRDWAASSKFSVIFDPEHKALNDKPLACEPMYYELGFADPSARERVFAQHPDLPRPTHDDKPYFYAFKHPGRTWFSSNATNMPIPLMAMILTICILLLFLPLLKLPKGTMTGPVLWSAVYFAITGFAFLLYETSIIQLLNVFVGGPTYSLAVVLVAVLYGYSVGSWLATRAKFTRLTYVFSGIGLSVLFLCLYFVVPRITTGLLPLCLVARLAVAAVITLISSAAVAMVVTSAMAVIRNRFGNVVAWMWGISSIANAIGSISFVAVTQVIGISSCLLVVAVTYLIANIIFSFRVEAS